MLSVRELEVAERVAQGMSNRQIADELVISVRTAEYHVAGALRKLGLDSRKDLRSFITKVRNSRRRRKPAHGPLTDSED